MSKFEVDCSRIKAEASEISSIYKRINSLKNTIESCKSSLRYCLSPGSYNNIRRSLDAAEKSLEQQAIKLSKLSSGLSRISSIYSSSETSIKSGKITFADYLQAADSAARTFVQKLIEDGSINDSVWSDEKSGSTEFLGMVTAGTISGSVFGYDVSTKGSVKWGYDKETGALKDAGVEGSVSASVYGAKGSAEGSIGALSGKAEGSLLNASATGSIGATLFKDGKLSPSVQAKLKAKANVAEGEVSGKFGNDNFNAHGKASGELLGASAEASGGIGMITYKDKAGNQVTAAGVQGKVGAEYYVAQGTVSGGFTLFGVKIDASVSGKAGGAGVSASGQVTTNGVSGSIGAGLGLGGGVSISVDWSDAVNNFEENWNGVCSTVSKGWDKLSDSVSKWKFW